MNRNQRIVVSIVGIIIVTLALIGITYAYFLTKIIGNSTSKSISGTLANLELTYSDGNGVIAPTDPIMPGTTLKKTFSVQNTGTARVDNYAVIFENVTNTLTRKEDLIYTLTCTSDDENPCKGVNDIQFPSEDSFIIYNSIEPTVTHSYTLTVTYKNLDNIDQSDDMGESFSAKVNIKDFQTVNPYSTNTDSLAYKIINNSMSSTNGTTFRTKTLTDVALYPSINLDKYVEVTFKNFDWNLWSGIEVVPSDSYRIEGNQFILSNNKKTYYEEIYSTLKGKYIVFHVNPDYATSEVYEVIESTKDKLTVKMHILRRENAENTLSAIEDQYGVSYYYRGGVEDNYLTFNNMCWRIVRIQGDGSVKLILQDKNQECGADTDDSRTNIGSGTYGYSGNSSNAKADYLNCTSDSESCMKNQFTSWFNSKFTSVKGKLKEETYYLDDTNQTYRVDKNLYEHYEMYETGRRLNGWDIPKSVNLLKKSNPFMSYIAPITADEAVLAGVTTSESGYENYYHYLYTTTNEFFALGLDRININYSNADYVFVVGSALASQPLGYDMNLRPTIVLKANTEVTGQGTKADPYVVKN